MTTPHNGKLDEQGKHEVSYWPQDAPEFVCIEETDDLRDEPDFAQLTPAQALSLLAWLKQEEATLQKLASEVQGV